ncbi:MAG: DUF1127 domain-containing protein [Rhodovibrionaceae bacterium]
MNRLHANGQTCASTTLDRRSSVNPGGTLSALTAPVFAGIGLLATWADRWEQRRQLAQLDARLLRDIGLDRREAVQEINKPFWME